MSKIPIWEAVHRSLIEEASMPTTDANRALATQALRDAVGAMVPALNAGKPALAAKAVSLAMACTLMQAKETGQRNAIDMMVAEAGVMREELKDLLRDEHGAAVFDKEMANEA